jgi:Arc/MetJ-type ribon-helix-helix transcriptional regulator
MVITITPEIEELVNDLMKSGEFTSHIEVILTGLHLLKAQREEIARLRRAIQRGGYDMQHGRRVSLKTDAEVEAFANEIIRQAEERPNISEV